MKETFISDLKVALYEILPPEKISDVVDVILLQMSHYDLTRKSTEVVVADKGDSELLKRFFIAKATEGLTSKSLITYQRVLSWALGMMGKHLNDVKTDDVRLLIASMRLNNKSAAYQNLVRRTLNSLFGWLNKEGHILINPMLRINCIKEPKKIREPFTEDELENLRLNAGSLRNELIIEFLYCTGCRVSELVGLNIGDINLEDNEALVFGKGQKYRKVYLSPRCKALLQKYLNSRKDSEEALFISDYSGWVGRTEFFAERGCLNKRLSSDAIREMVSHVGKKAKVSDVHPHRFRRTAATLALRRGMKITDVQKMLGHTDIKTTTIYAITTDDELKREHQKYLI